MKIVTANEYDQEIKDGVVLVDFFADWCGPCKMIAPVLEELANSYQDKAKIVKVNVDNEPALAQRYGIMSIPTLILFKDAEVVKTVVGFQSKAMLEQLIDSAL
ncbi:MAG: thioredoxin [Erysipelotrichaceae bacterium]|nr:thioredoxin [Erysipelotrichaceae bacterium]